nr:MAG TPA: hypothetical protein [Caudoviricetes sp.]
MASLAEKYVFERLATLEKEHDEHLKGSSATTEKEPENTDGVEFKKEPITAVRYMASGSWVFKDKDYGLNDVDRLHEVLEMDDKHLYEWATNEYGEGYHTTTPITRQETDFAYQIIDMRIVPNAIYASEKNSVGCFQYISDTPTRGSYCTLDNDDAAKAKAIEGVRYSIQCAIEHLENGTDEEEEDSDE